MRRFLLIALIVGAVTQGALHMIRSFTASQTAHAVSLAITE